MNWYSLRAVAQRLSMVASRRILGVVMAVILSITAAAPAWAEPELIAAATSTSEVSTAAKAALVAASAEIPAKFETEAMDDDSEAKPEVWTNWDDFVAKSNALATAAGAIDTASIESIGAGMGGVGGGGGTAV